MARAAPGGLQVGDQLGHLEYVIDAAALSAYRRLVGEPARYPNLAADDCRALLSHRCGSAPLTTVWQRFHFLRPPVLGRRVQVGGWLRELREKGSWPWLRVAAFAVDEIGTEILRSEAAFIVGRPDAGPLSDGSVRQPAASDAGSLADGLVGDCFALGRLALPDDGAGLADYRRLGRSLAGVAAADDANGLVGMIAGWLEGRISGHFGDDFWWGGQLSAAYRGAVAPGDVLSGAAVVIGCDADACGVLTRRIVISVSNQSHARVATGEAVVKVPSPRLL